MLLIDENKMKLLKMTEKLLEVAIENRDKVLADYKNITVEIDNSLFLALIEKIKNTDYHNHSLEEQFVILSDIENEYNELYELECSFKNTYETYSKDELVLSDLNKILIDKIRNKLNAIQGYLLGTKIVEESKNKIEDLNIKLVAEEKKRLQIQEKFRDLELKLKENFINAEGRIYDYQANLKYTSVIQEYNEIGFDIKKMLNDCKTIDEEINKMNLAMNSSEEKLKAAKICFDNDRSRQNEDVYNSILKENAYLKYKYLLLNIASLIAKEYVDYNMLKQKRNSLIMLNKQRVECLNLLGIRLSIDPIDRIKINEQLSLIESIGNNEEKIATIRKEIVNLSSIIENKIDDNRHFQLITATDDDFIADSQNLDDLTKNNNIYIEATDKKDEISDNEVISIHDVNSSFMLQRAQEKTHEVVKRVYEMFCIEPDTKEEVTSPELVISKEQEFPETSENLNMDLDKSNENNNSGNDDKELEDNLIFDDIIEEEHNHENGNDNAFNDSLSDDLFTSESNEEIFNDSTPKEKELLPEENIFEDVSQPFDSIPLFSDKYDSDETIATNTDILPANENDNSKTNEEDINNNIPVVPKNDVDDSMNMPEIFWSVEDNNNQAVQEGVSFDEQIDALMDEHKVLKKVS